MNSVSFFGSAVLAFSAVVMIYGLGQAELTGSMFDVVFAVLVGVIGIYSGYLGIRVEQMIEKAKSRPAPPPVSPK